MRWFKNIYRKKKTQLNEKESMEGVIATLLHTIVAEFSVPKDAGDLNKKIKKFTGRSLKEQITRLPSFYLFLEQYLISYDRSVKHNKTSLRNLVRQKFPQVTRLETCQLIFESENRQQIMLARLFLLKMLKRAHIVLGASGGNQLTALGDWMNTVPDEATMPPPLIEEKRSPQTSSQWIDLLARISYKIFSEIETRFNESFARSFYESTYNEIAIHYKELEHFSCIIALIPHKILDEEKINLLSKQQLNRMLLDKVDHLQKINEEITQKNEKIKSQKRLLEDAQDIIKAQNKELQQANLLLEDKVKERTNQLNLAFQKLLRANKELDLFVYRTAHDLKGPIARFLGLCHVAQIENEGVSMLDYIKRLENSAIEMDHMLAMLLRTSEITNKSISKENIDLKAILRDIWRGLSLKFDVRSIHLDIKINNPVTVESDPSLLTILLTNLLTNAIQYRDREKAAQRIEVVIKAGTKSETIIIVKDNGLGIDQSLGNKVFDMFFRGSASSQGPGLGLYESKCIVNKLNGEIKLHKSKPGITAFKITLPRDHTIPFLNLSVA